MALLLCWLGQGNLHAQAPERGQPNARLKGSGNTKLQRQRPVGSVRKRTGTVRRGNPSPRLSKEYKPRGVRTPPRASNRPSVRSVRHRYQKSGSPSPLLSKRRGVSPRRGNPSPRLTRAGSFKPRRGNPSPLLSKEYKPRGVRTPPRAGNRSSVRSVRHRLQRSGSPSPLLSKRRGVAPRRGNPSPTLARVNRFRPRKGNPSPLLSKEYKPRGVRTPPARGGFRIQRIRHREPGLYARNRVRGLRHGRATSNQLARPFTRRTRHMGQGRQLARPMTRGVRHGKGGTYARMPLRSVRHSRNGQYASSLVRGVRHGKGGTYARTPLRGVRHRNSGEYARIPLRGVKHGRGGTYARTPLRGVRHRNGGEYARIPLRGVKHGKGGAYARIPLRSVRHRNSGEYARIPLRGVRHKNVDGTTCSKVRIRHQRLDGTSCARVRIRHRVVDGTSCARLKVKHRQYDGTACAKERIRHRQLDGTTCSRVRIRHSQLDGLSCNRVRIRHRQLDGTTCARLKIKHTPIHKYRVPCDPSMRHTTQWEKLAMDVQHLMRNHKKYCKLNNVCSGVSAGQIVQTQDFGTAVVADYIIGERIQRFVRYTSEDSTRKKVVVRKSKAVEQLVVLVQKRQDKGRNKQGEVSFKRVLLSYEESKAIMIDYLLKKDQVYWIIRMYPEEKKNLPELLTRSQYRHYGGVTVPMGIPNIPYPRQLKTPPSAPAPAPPVPTVVPTR